MPLELALAREFQLEIDKASRDSIEEQIEETARLLESDLRAIWPQLHDLVDEQLASDIKTEVPHALPDFAGERRRLLHAVQMAMSARGSGSNVEDLAQLFRRTARWLRRPISIETSQDERRGANRRRAGATTRRPPAAMARARRGGAHPSGIRRDPRARRAPNP